MSSSNPKSIHLRCTLWRTRGIFCNGTGRIDLENNLLYPKHVHSHTEADYQSDIISLKNRIKRRAEASTKSLRQVFDDVTSSDQAGAMVTYKNVRNTMLKRRRLELPGNPKTPEQKNIRVQTKYTSTDTKCSYSRSESTRNELVTNISSLCVKELKSELDLIRSFFDQNATFSIKMLPFSIKMLHLRSKCYLFRSKCHFLFYMLNFDLILFK